MKTRSSFILNQTKDLIEVDMIAYQRLIKKLMYLGYGRQADIAFIVGQLITIPILEQGTSVLLSNFIDISRKQVL